MDLYNPCPLMPPLKQCGPSNQRSTGKTILFSQSLGASPTDRTNYEVRAKTASGLVSSIYQPPTQARLHHAIARSGQVSLHVDNNKDDSNPQRLIERLVSRLPDDLQSNIMEVTNLMSSSIKRLEMVIENQKAELRETKSAHDRRKNELHASLRNCEVYRGRVADAEEKYNTLVDVVGLKDKRSSKTQLAISRLNETNLTLTDALSLIHLNAAFTPPKKSSHVRSQVEEKYVDGDVTDDDDGTMWFTPGKDGGESTDTVLRFDSAPPSPYSQKSKSETLPLGKIKLSTKNYEKSTYSKVSHGGIPEEDQVHVRERKNSILKGENMRNTMLKLTREKYRYTKKIEILGNEVEDLKKNLKLSELKCRHLQINLAEFTGTDSNNDFSFSITAAHALLAKTRDFGPQDDLFRMMIEKRAIDPVESILQFRRIVDLMARTPGGALKVQNVASHMCSEHMIQILNVDVVCVYILDMNNENLVSKYTVRSESCEVFDHSGSSSILSEVIRTGKILKFADIKLPDFDVKIDGCPGIVVRNILSVPIKNDITGRVIGAIHLVNKIDGKVAFTELDETFATFFSLMASSYLQGCQKFQHVSYRGDVLTSILSSTNTLLGLLPHRCDVFVKDLHMPELLKVLEHSCQSALKCFRVKAFIVSDTVLGMPGGYLVFRQEKGRCSPNPRRNSVAPLDHTQMQLGIAGFVARTKKWSVQDGDADVHFHPDVDLDPQGMPCVTLSVLDTQGDVLVCLQIILGPTSPKMHLSDSRADGITFEQAAQWYVHTLSTPLQCVLDNMNKKTQAKEDSCGPVDALNSSSAEGNKEDTFNSFSAVELASERQQRDHLISLGILDVMGKAKQTPTEWAASIVKNVEKPYVPSVARSGAATPGSVWSRRSSV